MSIPRLLRGSFFALFLFAALAGLPASGAAAESPAPRRLEVIMRDGLRFDPPRLQAAPGEALAIELTNDDSTDMPHNFSLLRPGTRERVVALATQLGADGPSRQYIPQTSDILAHSRLLAAGEGAVLKLQAPSVPGVYPYVCLFPGHGFVMYGALYVGVPMPPVDQDRNIPAAALQTVIAGGGRRPFVQRIFMPDCGPAAIAVALPGDENYCWDAGQCRLRYAWRGTFVDASENWDGNGRVLAAVPAKPWWRAPQEPLPPTKFLGYRLTPSGPEFHYLRGGREVYERIEALPGNQGLVRHLRYPGAAQDDREVRLSP